MTMICADCNQLKHPCTECQTPEEKSVDGYPFPFETTPHVCGKCGSIHWHANLFYVNLSNEWRQDEPAFWCSNCDSSVDITPLKE